MAKSRSMLWASRKASTASSYWKLWRAVTPRRKAGCAAAEPELGKRTGDKTTSATSASGATAAMLAPPWKASCRLRPVTPTAATRRRFLGASAGAALGTWLDPRDPALLRALASNGSERLRGTLPFVGEGTFPLGRTVGAGLGQRRALDLSTLSRGTLVI